MRKLAGRVAVVTGAGSGIGRATSIALARKGCDLALVDLSQERLDETAAEVTGLGRRATTHIANVADRARMTALPDEIVAQHGGVQILVNNAGVNLSGDFTDTSLDDGEWLLDINLRGVIYGCKLFLPHLLEADAAHIVNISSLAGYTGLPTQSYYCASKAGVAALTESLWVELSHTKVGVTHVHPGPVRTSLMATSRTSDQGLTDAMVDLLARYAPKPRGVARRIVGAIRWNRRHVRIGITTALTHWAVRLWPGLVQSLIGLFYRRRARSR